MILFGPAGSGKTSFKNLLLGTPPPFMRVSTPLAVRPVALHRIDIGDQNAKWKNLTLQERKTYLARAINGQASNLRSRSVPVQNSSVASTTTEANSSESGENKYTTHEELVDLIDQSSRSGSMPIACYRMFQIVDSGGQPQFLEILPIFLRRLSYYVFVFKLSDDLDSHTTVELYDEDGNPVGIPYASPLSNMQLLQHYLQALQSHKSSTIDGKNAQILILGTHKDEESKCTNETREKKNEKIKTLLLLPAFKDDVVYSGVRRQPIFAVNAKSPADEDEKVAEQIRLLVMKDNSTKPAAEIPLRWYALELLLEEMTDTLGRGVLSLQECLAAASHFDEKTLKAALVFLDGLSVGFYYKDILPKVVFTNSQVLLDKASELVKAKYELQNKSYTPINEEWQKFNDNALVSLEFLTQDKFLTHYVPEVFSPVDLIKLFKKLFIFGDFGNEMLFMPALLEFAEEDAIEGYRRSFSSESFLSPLVVEYSPSIGIFCALTCFLLSERNSFPNPWRLSPCDDGVTPSCLYHNCIKFDILRPCSVLLIESFNYLEIHVFMTKKALKFFDCGKLCSSITNALDKGLKEASTALGYSSSQHNITLLCPCSKERAHSASLHIARDCCLMCSVDHQFFEPLNEGQEMWLQGNDFICIQCMSHH